MIRLGRLDASLQMQRLKINRKLSLDTAKQNKMCRNNTLTPKRIRFISEDSLFSTVINSTVNYYFNILKKKFLAKFY